MTEPPGALVYDNDELKGPSPVTYDFLWYGWHRIIIRKDGFERVQERKLVRSPVYLWIPLDLGMELLPFPVTDRRRWSYTLNPLPTLPSPTPPTTEPAVSGRGSPEASQGRGTTTESPPQAEESSDGQTR